MQKKTMFQPFISRKQDIVMNSGLYRTDKSKAKYKPESSTQKGRVNPPLRGEAYGTNGREGEGEV